MYKFTIFFFSIIFISKVSLSQKNNYQIVTDNDTINAIIEEQDLFQKNILKYNSQGSVSKEQSQINLVEINSIFDSKGTVYIPLFFADNYRLYRELVFGYTSLYKDERTEQFFILNNGKFNLIENSFIEGRLSVLLGDCFTTPKEKIEYSNRSLTETIITYNECAAPNEEIVKRSQKINSKLVKGIRLGYLLNTLAFPGETSRFYDGEATSKSSLMVGLFLEFKSYKSPISISIELNHMVKGTTIQKTVDPVSTNSELFNYTDEFYYKSNILNFPISFKYYPLYKSQKSIQPYFLGGFDNGILFNKEIIIENDAPDFIVTQDFMDTRNYESGFLAAIGLSKKISDNYYLLFEGRFSSNIFKSTLPSEEVLRNRFYSVNISFGF